MNSVFDVLSPFFSMTSGFYICAMSVALMQCFFDSGIAWSRRKACVLGIYSVLSELVVIFFPENLLLNLLSMLAYVAIPIYDCKGKIIRRALKIAGTYLMIMFCTVCVMMIGFTYFLPEFNANSAITSETELFLINLCTSVVFGAVFHFLKQRIIKRGLFIPCGKREKISIFFYVVFTFAIYAVISFSSENGFSWSRSVQAFMSVICILLLLLFPVFIFHARISDQYRRMYEYQETYLEAELEHFRRYRDAQQETVRFRHDIRNHLVCLDELLSSGKNEEASELLCSLLDEVRSLSPQYVSGDEVLDCIISAKAATMEQQGIVFSLDGVIAGGLDWKAIDVCGVFANALDNAADACLKLPAEQRHISMTLKATEQFHYVRIENPVDADVDVSRLFSDMGGYTTKRAAGSHGIGTYNIKRIVEKYGGIIKAECTGGVFTLELMFTRASVA